jgi:hypothetical protein
MTKVMICGMTAAQSSQRFNASNKTFASSVSQALERAGATVHWRDPSLEAGPSQYSEYDKVLVGIAPVLSLGSSKAYLALSAIATLYGTDKLVLFVDAPEPGKLHASARAVHRNPSSLVKDLYKSRKGHAILCKDSKKLKHVLKGVEILKDRQWPATIFPALPWHDTKTKFEVLPDNASSAFSPVYADALIGITNFVWADRKNKIWTIENEKSKWFAKTANQLTFPYEKSKDSRLATYDDVSRKIALSWGTVIAPHDDKILWWSPRFVQAMECNSPVVTEWRLSSSIGDSWSFLPSSIEQMTLIDTHEASVSQRIQYFSKLPSTDDAIQDLLTKIGAN